MPFNKTDDDDLGAIFDDAAKAAAARREREARSPALTKIVALINSRFENDSSFTITETGRDTITISSPAEPEDAKIVVQDRRDGTFDLYTTGEGLETNKTPQQITIALAKFYDAHKDSSNAANGDFYINGSRVYAAASATQQPTLYDVLALPAFLFGINRNSNFSINALYCPARPEVIQSSVELAGEIRIDATYPRSTLTIRESKNNIGTFEIERNGTVLDTDASLDEIGFSLTKFQAQNVDPSAVAYRSFPGLSKGHTP